MAKVIDMSPEAQAEYCSNHPNSKICLSLNFGKTIQNKTEQINTESISSKIDKEHKKLYLIAGIDCSSPENDDLLEMLSSDNSSQVRHRVGICKYTPPSVLETLSKDSYDSVRRGVASNRNVSKETLHYLANDATDEVVLETKLMEIH